MAILGRREEPTDGVHDYCCYLRDALAKEGVNLSLTQVRWAEIGRKASRKELLEAVEGKQNTFFLLQYTALSWSRRGFALSAVSILKLLKKNGARCAVVFHDPDGYAGNRAVDRFRRGIQRYAMKRLVRLSDLAVFTLPRNKISWLPADTQNFVFIPVGANLPAPERAWEKTRSSTGNKRTVVVFSLSDKPTLHKEVSQIAQAVRNAATKVGSLEIVVLGRNSETGGEALRLALAGSGAEVRIVGLVSADEVVRILGASDVMLFARGPISTRRGSAIAGIACGLPVIAEAGSELAPPITEAGVVLVPEELVPEGYGPALVRVLSDPSYRASLSDRSRDAQSRYFSWSVIARQYAQVLRALGGPSARIKRGRVMSSLRPPGLTYTDAQSDNLNEDSRTPLLTLEEQRLHAAEASGGISSEVIYDPILKVIGDYNLRGRALDYGAGIGNFTRKLLASGRFEQIDSADILPRPENLPSAISWHRLDLNDATAIPPASFDVVIAAEVIEHLENPRKVARNWFQILKPGGTLILSTPNNESIRSLMALLVRGHFVAFLDSCYPAHITALLRKDLMRILSEAGFSDVRFHFTDHGGLPKLPAVSWQQVSLGLLKGCRFSDNVIGTAKVPTPSQ